MGFEANEHCPPHRCLAFILNYLSNSINVNDVYYVSFALSRFSVYHLVLGQAYPMKRIAIHSLSFVPWCGLTMVNFLELELRLKVCLFVRSLQ